MASLNGVSGAGTGTNTYGMNGLKGFGGLATGLDRDTLIENMTYGTTSKIAKQKQQKTLLEWKQTAIRNIADKMIDFANKYTATMTSSKNLFSNTFWGKATVTALGTNSNLVSLTGSMSAAKDFSIEGVKQLARKASWSSGATDASSFTGSAAIDETAQFNTLSELAGTTLDIKYGDKSYSVKMEGDFSTPDEAMKSIQASLEKVKLSDEPDAKSLADVLKIETNAVTADDGTSQQRVTIKAADGVITDKDNADYKELKLTGGSALSALGFKEVPKEDLASDEVNANGVTGENNIEQNFNEWIAGKQMTFRYNGKTATIALSKEDLEKDGVQGALQHALDKTFGTGRITVGVDGDNKLQFQTTKPNSAEADSSSVLTLVSGDKRLVGETGVLGLKNGDSTHTSMSDKLSQTEQMKDLFDDGNGGVKDKISFTINNAEIELTKDDTYSTLMNKINNSGANVQVAYQEASGQFTFTAKEDGASGAITFGGEAGEKLKEVFQLQDDKYIEGQDAIVTVKYGNGEAFNISRGTNTFGLDGLTVTVKGTFGEYGDDEILDKSDAVTFNVQTNSDEIVKDIKDMIEEYNSILELVNKELSTRPDRDYAPLTAEQKKELDEDEAKTYEEKAKEGILFGDSTLASLANDLRFMINPRDLNEFKKLGITVSDSWSDNGKLVIDEEKLKAALEENPDKVKEMFTREKSADGTAGIATNLTNVLDKYVKTMGQTKGLLIEQAGTSKAPASITKNKYFNDMKSIDEKIAELQKKLKVEQDRYIRQFTSLETVISQMNAQSGWLSQFGA